ncbi:MAG: hypothetical protein WD889_02610 [Candidatus Colwellbacteria bacterium]
MATETEQTMKQLPFRVLAEKGEVLAEEIESRLKELSIVLRDIDATERNEAWKAAVEQGRERYDAALTVARRARYVLNVVDAQCIGNASEAWHTGVRRLREALDELEELSS